MKRYMAVNGESAIYLSRAEQIEKYRENGCSIYEIDGIKTTLIAGPEKALEVEIEFGRKETGGLSSGKKG